MKINKTKIIALLIFVVSMTLRLYMLTARAPFDWDQARDYHEISKIASGKITLIGPVAKGEGGFFLGPLYYYLLLPIFSLFHQAPIALPITSVFFDSLAVIGFLYLGISVGNPLFGYLLSLIWAVSPGAISMSAISWNVSLVPLWTSIFLILCSKLKKNSSNLYLLTFGLVTGLSWHIHAALIPLAAVTILYLMLKYHLSLKSLLVFFIGYILALAPLIYFDIRHAGLESNLIKQMYFSQAHSRADLLSTLSSTLARTGKNLETYLIGSSNLNPILGLFVVLTFIITIFNRTPLIRLLSIIGLLNIISVIALGSLSFPEYYLLLSTIAVIAIYLYTITLSKYRLWYLALVILIIQLIHYPNSKGPFSLANKINLAKAMVEKTPQATIIYDLPFGRESGFDLLYQQYHGQQRTDSDHYFLITESSDQSIFINGEIATDLGYFGGYRLGEYYVQK